MNIHTPMITQGWNDLISFYADQFDKLVVFKYFGNSSFQLHVSKRACDSTLKANFFNHLSIRRPLHTSNLKHFEVQLSTYSVEPATWLVFFFIIYLHGFLISKIFYPFCCSIWKKNLPLILKTMVLDLLFYTDQGGKSNVNWS